MKTANQLLNTTTSRDDAIDTTEDKPVWRFGTSEILAIIDSMNAFTHEEIAAPQTFVYLLGATLLYVSLSVSDGSMAITRMAAR
jgi:hypothetical protein